MTTQNWIIVAIAVLIIMLVGFNFWPAGQEPTASQEEPTAAEPAEPESAY